MITVEQAAEIISENVIVSSAVETNLIDSLGLVIADEVIAPIDVPAFSNSAMDGYAVCLKSDSNLSKFKLKGELKAGDNSSPFKLDPGDAIRIFTGAAIPVNATCVIKQEDVETAGNEIVARTEITKGTNIRKKGEEIKKGEIALRSGSPITPAIIGFLANLGLATVNVFRKPKISVIVTGNELIPPGQPLEFGKIYESNSFTLVTALQSKGFNECVLYRAKDTLEETKSIISKSLGDADVILITGGISVGDYDFTGKALKELGVKELFYKVRQKPGKPLMFGKFDKKLVFALPGNPAAVLTHFYIHVLPALRKMMGHLSSGNEVETLRLKEDYYKKGSFTHFLRARKCGKEVQIIPEQGSNMLRSYVGADVLVYVPEEVNELKAGDDVQAILI